MAGLGVTPGFWTGRRVFLTGHTGFKGGWLALWLDRLGAEVAGLALDPPTQPSLFEVAGVAGALAADHRADVADDEAVAAALSAFAPSVVVHMAAQSLVRDGYLRPLETYRTNVVGTGAVLLAARDCPSVEAVVVVTSDKCYENREWIHPYRESDRLGGFDPYSSSKACAEIVTASFRDSFPGKARIATARAGNVIGGGDWAKARIAPDCVRAFRAGAPVTLRRPDAIRPWQHVLEPIAGYLALAEQLVSAPEAGADSAWNFGPDAGDERTVREVAGRMAACWGDGARVLCDPDVSALHEAGLLRLDSTRARVALGWRPVWDFAATIERTASWYRAWADGADMGAVTAAQIDDYAAARARGEAA